jgi:pantetheine-phosphate adenylyltransferase
MMTRQQIFERFIDSSLATEIRLVKEDIAKCLDEWERPHRFYHGLNHLSNILKEIDDLDETIWSMEKKDKMSILALFHDVIYDPRKTDNEDKSIEFVKGLELVGNLEEIFEGIRYTQYKKDKSYNMPEVPDFIRLFCDLDIGPSVWDDEGTKVADMVKREILLIKEFQFVDFSTYKNKRIEFIKNFPYFVDGKYAVDFLSNYRPKIGVYAGSFSPFHKGHLNILEQAEKIFDKVIIAQGNNPDKNMRENLWMPPSILPFHECVQYFGLLSDYLKTLNYADVTVIRGLRSGYDLDYEMNQLRILEDYGCKCPVIYFVCSKETSHVSSSMIRGLCKFPNSGAEKYIPPKYNYAKNI